MIDIQNPFIALADCEIYYDGRASSTLQRGNYLLIYKKDHSFSVNAGSKIGPRNYQGAGSRLDIISNNPLTIISVNKKETIKIIIYLIHWLHDLNELSSYDVKVTKTEQELVQRIVANPTHYFGGSVDSVTTEYPTSAGPVDIVARRGLLLLVVEVKRNTININNCVQLRKYMEALDGPRSGYVAGPSIASSALTYCQKHDYQFIPVLWN